MNRFLLYIITISILSSCNSSETLNYDHPYRPQIHFSPEKNWMNDPNGMFYDNGLYHLYYQYNPFGEKWGHMSWGHATSEDLVHWEHHPVALLEEDGVMIFSGSAVVDKDNTSGLGTEDAYPIVAIYTGHMEGNQSQHIAYSLDGGYTFTKFEGNPVLDLNMKDFRDPKVFWYEPDNRWIMVVALSAEQKLHFYGSENLIDWEFLSEFGPLGAQNGLWECPDLFLLPVINEKDTYKWVLQVDLGSNSNTSGSGGQYFVGDFDGISFTPEEEYLPTQAYVPSGIVFEDFENGLGAWEMVGDAFTLEANTGAVDGQQPVTGFKGERLANSFNGGDVRTGHISSELFTIEYPYINMLVGGGSSKLTRVQLVIDNEVVLKTEGRNSEHLKWYNWDVGSFVGQQAKIEVVDESEGGWGHILVDHIQFSNEPAVQATEGAKWVDYGADFYAAVSWFTWDDNKPTEWLGWANNWGYAQDIPTSGWRGAMSLARTVELEKIDNEYRLYQKPIDSYKELRFDGETKQDVEINGKVSLFEESLAHGVFELKLEFEGEDPLFELILSDNKGGMIQLKADEATNVDGERNSSLQFTRLTSDTTFYSPVYNEQQRIFLKQGEELETIHLIYDKSVVEVYINGGSYTFVNRSFMDNDHLNLTIKSQDSSFKVPKMEFWKLKSTWVN